MSFLEVVKS